MTISWEDERQCPACEAEWASVVVEAPQGQVLVGPRCAGLIVALGKLMGLDTRKRPLLQAVQNG